MTITITNGTYTSQVQYEHTYERLANYADIPHKVIGPFSDTNTAINAILSAGYDPLKEVVQVFAKKVNEDWNGTGGILEVVTPVICRFSKLYYVDVEPDPGVTYSCLYDYVVDTSNSALRRYNNSTDGDIYVVLAKAN